MVIQRIQTLFLLIATVLLVVFYFIPFGYWNVVDGFADLGLAPLKASVQPALAVPVWVAAVLTFVAIFLFKKASLQKCTIILSIIATLASIVMVIYLLTKGYVYTEDGVTITAQWGCGGLFLVVAVIMQIAAYRGVCADQKLLRSYDRLR